MKRFGFIAAVLCFMVFYGCAPRYGTPIKDPSVPIELKGFSVLPPQGKGWFLARKNLFGVFFVKKTVKTSGGPHTFIAKAELMRSAEKLDTDEDFQSMMDRSMTDQYGQRYSLKEHESHIEHFKDTTCVSERVVAEDREVPGNKGRLFKMYINSLSCLHPGDDSLVVDIGYSQRVPPGVQAVEMVEGEAFLRSFQFKPAN